MIFSQVMCPRESLPDSKLFHICSSFKDFAPRRKERQDWLTTLLEQPPPLPWGCSISQKRALCLGIIKNFWKLKGDRWQKGNVILSYCEMSYVFLILFMVVVTFTFQVYCFQDRFHFLFSSSYSPWIGPAIPPQIMARFQPHRTPEEGLQSHNYLLALFQRFPWNEAAGLLSQNALPQWAAPWQFQTLLDFWHEHRGPMCWTVSEVVSSISEKADLERENVGRMCLFEF